jgi:hypothetical protein
MNIPSLQIVFLPNLFDDSQGKQFGIESGECTPFEELPRPHHHIILKELNQSVIEAILAEEDSTSEVKIEESDESCMLHLKVHCFEDGPLCLLVILLSERLVSISLIPVQIWHVFVQLHSLSSNNQSRTRPKPFTGVQLL